MTTGKECQRHPYAEGLEHPRQATEIRQQHPQFRSTLESQFLAPATVDPSKAGGRKEKGCAFPVRQSATQPIFA